jgi:hypothetical protein
LGFKGFRLGFRPHEVYFFELSIKFYIKSSPKTLKLVYISRESEYGAKNSYGRYPTEFVFWGQKWKITSVRPISSFIQKEKSLTWKYPSKIRRTKFSFGLPWNHGRRTVEWRTFFFRKNRFIFDKKSKFVQKIDKKKFGNH